MIGLTLYINDRLRPPVIWFLVVRCRGVFTNNPPKGLTLGPQSDLIPVVLFYVVKRSVEVSAYDEILSATQSCI